MNPATAFNDTTAEGRSLGGKYLTFSLAGEPYGIGILKIREIIGMIRITRVPRTPEFVKGVINLRGKVIPVVDLRGRFRLPEADYTKRTCIIVVEVRAASGTLELGLIVDTVSEVLNIKGGDIEPPPLSGTRVDTRGILGVAKINDGVNILLDIDNVLSRDEIGAARQAA